MDLIGPCEIKQKDSKNELKSQAVAMIDPATGWFETHECDDKRALITCSQGNELLVMNSVTQFKMNMALKQNQ